MNRDLVINVLLIIAGIVLAIALFGAGVWWRNSAPGTSRPLSLVWLVFRSEAGRQCLRLENLQLSPNANALCRCTEKDRGGAEGAIWARVQGGKPSFQRIAIRFLQAQRNSEDFPIPTPVFGGS